MQSPGNWFEDFGSCQLKSGATAISLDPTFASAVNAGATYPRLSQTPRRQQDKRRLEVRELAADHMDQFSGEVP
jgi:hypothetical protein